jgi:hypothetical protein
LLIYCPPSDPDEPAKKPVRPVAALTESNRGDVNRPRQDYVRRDDNRGYGAPRFDRGDEGGRGAPMRGGGGGGGGYRGRGGPPGVGRGAPRGRGGFAGGNYESRGKREYERHSGNDKT